MSEATTPEEPPVETTIPEVVIEAKKPDPPVTAQPNVNSVRSPNDGQVTNGSRLWMRKWQLTVGTTEGDKAEDLSSFDFEFSVEEILFQPATTGRIKVWNLGKDTIGRMASKELQKIELRAGYSPPSEQYGLLFAGQINYFRSGRQNATDTFIEVYASAFDPNINATVVNTWLPKGHTATDAAKACTDAMGLKLGQLPKDINKDPQPRGRLLYGNPRDCIRDIARTANGQPFVDLDGKLHILTAQEVLNLGNETVPILNTGTGMLDVPTRTIDGAIEVSCLLNPFIHPGKQIQIDNETTSNITAVDVNNLVTDAQKIQEAEWIRNAKGYYPVGSVKHQGQTRGNEWTSHIVCQKAVPPTPMPLQTLGG